MAIFAPVNMMGPAHRGPQLQALAQKAAQNVMQRQRLRTMLRTSAGAARAGAAPGGGQGLMTAQRGVHTALSQHAPNMPNQGIAAMLGGNGGASPVDTSGMYNSSGGGADFQSIPDPNDPTQSPASVGGSSALAAINPGGALWNGAASSSSNVNSGTSNGGGSLFTPNDGSTPSTGGGGLIPLNGGLFYDPVSDTVVGGQAPANYGGAVNGTAHGAGI